MQVIATAGHVDHGKSALLRALTGMEPDRWAEERRRGMTIDLGYVWMTLPSGEQLAFVDVPGHARFVPNMLAGVGPVPAVLFVVAADGGWMPQSAEHLAAIDALRITRGVLAVTRSDLADPGPAIAEAREIIGRSSLGEIPAVAVSAVTGQGLDELLARLAGLAADLPEPDRQSPIRIWVDRAFSITGAGTVVTGTLPAGQVSRSDELVLTPAQRTVRVRSLQSLGADVPEVTGVARVALNLRGIEADQVGRGMALVRPGEWTLTTLVDVRVSGTPRLPRLVNAHVGSARTVTRVRMLDRGLARLSLQDPLPLHVGDLVLLRDPGAAAVRAELEGQLGSDEWPGLAGAVVLDVRPPGLGRRGAAAAAVAELNLWPDQPSAIDLLRRHKLIRAADLAAMGLLVVAEGAGGAGGAPPAGSTGLPEPVVPGWYADPGYVAEQSRKLADLVASHATANPLAPGLPLDSARTALGLPDRQLTRAMLSHKMKESAGLIMITAEAAGSAGAVAPGPAGDNSSLPAKLAEPVAAILADLAANPFSAPDAARLSELGLDSRALAAAARHGALLRIADQLVLGPGGDVAAGRVLAGLPQPFTAAQARAALNTTRRTLIPLLEYLDRQKITRRLPDDRREVRASGSG
ncbi:MAG TPA: selenocysteine-specific translation elongation factor [Streptosporangiaceae bacterium]|nr:selenocysteine-specific translation elongation factor [Streptosporangiaceae bacterium]